MKRVRLVRATPAEVEYARDRSGNVFAVMGTACSSLDHIFRSTAETRNKHGVLRPETKCYCGARRWGGTGKPIEPISNASVTAAEKKVFTVRIKRQSSETEETDIMAKKNVKKSTVTRAWKRTYEFVKPLKAEPAKGTIKAAVYAGIKSVKSGDADEVTAAAVKAGLKDATDQDPRVQTMVWLRSLIADGAVRVKSGEKASEKPVKKTGKRVVLKKTA